MDGVAGPEQVEVVEHSRTGIGVDMSHYDGVPWRPWDSREPVPGRCFGLRERWHRKLAAARFPERQQPGGDPDAWDIQFPARRAYRSRLAMRDQLAMRHQLAVRDQLALRNRLSVRGRPMMRGQFAVRGTDGGLGRGTAGNGAAYHHSCQRYGGCYPARTWDRHRQPFVRMTPRYSVIQKSKISA